MDFGGSLDTDVLHDETFDLLCRICKRKNKNQEAQKYCVECDDYYCDSCVNVHEYVPSLTGHTILDKGQFPSGSTKMKSQTSQNLPTAPIERCDRHSDYYIDMYCQNHDDVGCATCMAAEHKSCRDTFYIPEFIQNNPSGSLPIDTREKLEIVANTLQLHYETFGCEKQRLLLRKEGYLEKVRKFRKEINAKLDEIENNSIADIEDRYKSFVVKLEEGMKWFEANQTNVSSARDKVEGAGINDSQDFVNAKKGNKVVSYAFECINANLQRIQRVDIDFTADPKIAAILKGTKALGKITQTDGGTLGISAIAVPEQHRETNEKQFTTGNIKWSETPRQMRRETGSSVDHNPQQEHAQVIRSKLYSVRIPSDEVRCDIVSACILEDGSIILSDHYNKKLKRLDSSTYNVIDYCDLPGQPMHVCSVGKYEVGVCLKSKREVHIITQRYSILSLRSRLTLSNKITTEFDCWGIAYANDKLYISDDKSIYIYSMSGQKLEHFRMDPSGQDLFTDIRSLAVNEFGSAIYIVDWDKGLVMLDDKGQVVGKFSGSQLSGACDCFLSRESLFVCGRYSNNVLDFGLRGELIGVVCNASHIQALCCNQQMSKMIIVRGYDEIEVYDVIKDGESDVQKKT